MTKATEALYIETKNGNKWERVNTITDPKHIHNSLEQTLIVKFLWKAAWIKKITDHTNNDGTRTITAYMDGISNDMRYIYIVNEC